MKLKKIASLALAGIMAVSMLAGCKSTGTADSSASSEAPAATGMVGKVIAALDTDKVAFTAGSELQQTLDILVENSTKTNASSALQNAITAQALVTMNPTLGSKDPIVAPETNNTSADGTDSKVQTSVFVAVIQGTNEALAADQIAAKIEAEHIGASNTVMSKLADKSLPNSATAPEYQYNFKYTGTMAVSTVKNSSTGEVTYVVAYTVTRTPTKAKYVK